MTISCLINHSDDSLLVIPDRITEPFSENNFVSSCGYTIGAQECGYCITPQHEYDVYGIVFWDGLRWYLIQDDENIPTFVPSTLFEVVNSNTFWDWEVCEYSIDGKVLFFIGYPKLAQEYRNLTELLKGKSTSVADFLEYKSHVHRYGFAETR